MLMMAAALACSTFFSNPHPHKINNAADAIATAYADWTAKSPEPREQFRLWQMIYSAKRDGQKWLLTPTVRGGKPGRGTYISLDAETGCIVSEMSFD